MQSLGVLHVDDNAVFRNTFKELFQKQLVTVWSCRDGAQAATIDSEWQVLVTDSSGYSFAEQILSDQPAIDVVVLSGNPDAASFLAEARIRKTDPTWYDQVAHVLDDVLAKFLRARYHRGVVRRDILGDLSAEDREAYSDKVLIVGGHPEQVLGTASDLVGAESLLASLRSTHKICRLVQGPILNPPTLQELEGD